MAATGTARTGAALWTRLGAGVVGGLAGGLVSGVLMQVMGMLPMVAALVDSAAKRP